MSGRLEAVGSGDESIRSASRLLVDPVFGRFLVGKLGTLFGIWIHNIVGAILAFQITHSAVMVAMVSIAQFVPQVLLSPLGGVMADRGDRVQQMLLGRVVCLAGSGGIAVALLVLGDSGLTSVVPLLAASLVVGIGFSIGSPAMQALVPALVRPGELSSAVALDNFPMMIGRAIGPALGATVALSVGFGPAFALAAIGHLVFLLLNYRLKVPRPVSEEQLGDGSVRSSLGYLRSRPAALLLILGVAAVGFGADPALTLAPSIAHDIGGGPQLAGGFASAFGVGAVVGFLCLPTLRWGLGASRLSCTGLVLLAAGSAGLSLIHEPVASLLAFAVSGAGMTIAVTGSTTMLYELVEDEWRGRIMAFWIVGFVGSRPFAAGLNGVLAESVSVEAALLATSAVVLAAAWLCRPANITPVSARARPPETP